MRSKKADGSRGYLNVFKIEHSGLYRIQRKSNEEIISKSYGLDTTTVFKALKEWVKDRNFKETAAWEIPEANKVADRSICYCKEVHECANGDFILVLWKHDPDDIAGYRGLKLDEKGVPSGDYYTSGADTFGDEVVWGHPCYYWVIPEKDLVISIKFDDSKCDATLMQKWVNYCVRFRLKFPDFNARSTGDDATRIFFSKPDAPETYNLLYRFSKSIIELNTTEEDLEEILGDIKFILLRNEVKTSAGLVDVPGFTLNSLEESNKELFEIVRNLIGKFFPSHQANDGKDNSVRKVEVKIEATPTIEDVRSFISYADSFEENGWSDIIFIDSEGEQTSIKSHRLTGSLLIGASGVHSGKTLEEAVRENRYKYMAIDASKIVDKQDENEETKEQSQITNKVNHG